MPEDSTFTDQESWGGGFHVPGSMTPQELGDTLAQLVWESFTDFIAESGKAGPLGALGLISEDGVPNQRAAEEALIFLMWAHTRGAVQAFMGRTQEELVKQGLDALHRAVFEDMAENGTPLSQLPIFEQRVSARYSAYHTAAADSDSALGASVSQYLAGGDPLPDPTVRLVVDRAIAVAKPLKDFLEEVELIPA